MQIKLLDHVIRGCCPNQNTRVPIKNPKAVHPVKTTNPSHRHNTHPWKDLMRKLFKKTTV
jgi:hypothetical protein